MGTIINPANNGNIIGRVANREPVRLCRSKAGTSFCFVTIAVKRPMCKYVDFVPVQIWGKSAEAFCNPEWNFSNKGNLIAFCGYLRPSASADTKGDRVFSRLYCNFVSTGFDVLSTPAPKENPWDESFAKADNVMPAELSDEKSKELQEALIEGNEFDFD